ncbi:MoaD/ThiS family protein [Reinekea thalattae]|nr:MoaD/ThiS family protein [Reinekea thalattae]
MIKITVKVFAQLREQLGVDELFLELNEPVRLSAVISTLQKQHPNSSVLQQANLMAAVNQTMVQEDCELHADDEIALFPPVTGG